MELTFESDLSEAQISNDLMRGVCLLGPVSKRGHIYSRQAQEDVASLARGCKVFLNHPSPTEEKTGRRDIGRLIGVVENARVVGRKVFGDVRLLQNDAAAQKLVSVAKLLPAGVGLSIDAAGEMSRSNGKKQVESVHQLNSIDLVARSATTNNLFESDGKDGDITNQDALKVLHGQSIKEDVMSNEEAMAALHEGRDRPGSDVVTWKLDR